MPKIIPDIEQKLLAETKKQVSEKGYAGTTIRSVAEKCGLGTGTVYNYFKSKNVLIEAFVVNDWNKCLEDMSKGIQITSDSREGLECVYNCLKEFSNTNHRLFNDSEAAKVFMGTFALKHQTFRHQLGKIIFPLCQNSRAENKEYLADCIADAILKLTVSGDSFEDIYSVLKLLL